MNKYFILYLKIVYFIKILLLGCQPGQKKYLDINVDDIAQVALQYAIENNCVDRETYFGDTTFSVISVSKNWIGIDSSDSILELDIKSIYQNSIPIAHIDTINIVPWDDVTVLMSDLKNMKEPFEFSQSFYKRSRIDTPFYFIKSYLISIPYIYETNGNRKIIVKIAKYFEYITDYTYVVFSVNMHNQILQKNCFKKHIPPPPLPAG